MSMHTTILQFRRMYVPRKQVDTIKSPWSPSSWDKHKTIILLRQHISEMADPGNSLFLPHTTNKIQRQNLQTHHLTGHEKGCPFRGLTSVPELQGCA